MTKIKICGLFRPCDVDAVNAAQPDWCGFVLHFPKSHRSVTEEEARALKAKLNPGITAVGVFVDRPPQAVAKLLLEGTIEIAQLHGREDEQYLAALRELAPGFPIWKAFAVRSKQDIERAEQSSADLVLLDSGQGTGKPFDWSLVAGCRRPFLLAGGLNPENLKKAVDTVHPYGIDLSSGVETKQKKDYDKIQAAVAAARKE